MASEMKRLPEEVSPPVIEGQALSVRLRIAADLFWLQGHFPALPVVPGIALLHWVLHYARRLAPWAALGEAELIKFTRLISPGEVVELRLSAQPAAGGVRVRFEFLAAGEPKPASCSKGKLLLRLEKGREEEAQQ